MVPEPALIQEKVRFDEFLLDLRLRELRHRDRVLKLERIPMEILVLLIEHSDRIVSREQIVERIWGRVVSLDTDNSINGAIRKIRQVLRDQPEQPRFVQTITGRGYRFIAGVDWIPAVNPRPALVEVPPPAALAVPANSTPATNYRRLSFLLGAVIILMAVLAVYRKWPSSQPPPASPAGRLMLAVLPFDNLTGDASQEYFSDGLTEEMITQLGQLDPQRLGIIARTSVIPYKQNHQPLDRIARELNVQYLLEGSVRRDATRVRVTAQLIRASDQTHLWAHEYDRELKDLLPLQGEIAREVAEGIQLTLETTDKRPSATVPELSPEAYDLYLKGRYFWNQRTREGFLRAIQCFERAINKDPNYARAYAGLADAYALMGSYYFAPQPQVMPQARTAALKALSIDEGLAEAHTSLALIAQNYDWDWVTAEKEYQRAIQLNPNYATAHHWYAESLAYQGRFEEALAESEQARHLDPLSLIIAADRGAILYFARRYDQAIEQFQSVLEMDPSFSRAYLIIAVYVQKGQFKDARSALEKWRKVKDGPWIWAWEAYVEGRAGDLAQAQRDLEKMRRLDHQWQLDPTPQFAVAYAGMNDKEKSLAWLDRARDEHSATMTTLKVDPAYDSLRDDPRFAALLKRAGLGE